jgi:hypothetical protein
VKNADSEGIRGVMMSWIPYFLNRVGMEDKLQNNSKYAYNFIMNLVDYMRADTTTKYRMDR